MSFVDEMYHTTDATFLMVDRRHAPGGHWNDAYPFVRLHQPSAYYGVNSTPLGSRQKEPKGLNKGFYELASGSEILNYYHRLMDEMVLRSNRIRLYSMCDYIGGGHFVELLSDKEHAVAVKKRIVNATHLTTDVPARHTRDFEIAAGVVCIPPNFLPRLAPRFDHVTVIGGGKTGVDSVIWLLSNGLPPDALSWVVPRDSWFQNRKHFQPGPEFFQESIGGQVALMRACAEAADVNHLCAALEESGFWQRLDPKRRPAMFHGATVSERELELLRRVRDIIREGRVRRIKTDKLVLDRGERRTDTQTLYVDCTAGALASNVNDRTPVFGKNELAIQMIRPFQPCFSGALIAHLEATLDDDAEKNSMCRPTPMVDSAGQWIRVVADGLANARAWRRTASTRDWIQRSRLNFFGDVLRLTSSRDRDKIKMLRELRSHTRAAADNLRRMGAHSSEDSAP